MPKLKLTYFDFDGGRGEVARLALAIGQIPFEDQRIPVSDWPGYRGQTPFHALPLLDVDGQTVTQSNAINRFVGQLANLYPDDRMQALRCDEVMDAVEDVVTRVVATFGIEDASALEKARGELVEGPIRLYLEQLQQMLERQGGRYFADNRLTIADLKVFVWIRNLRAGVLDHVPKDLVDRLAPRLGDHCDRIGHEPGVITYYERRGDNGGSAH